MISIDFITPQEMRQKIAQKARAKRLSLNWSQKTLSERSGVSYGVLKKFEHTGQISLQSLLQLAVVMGSMKDFYALFAPLDPAYGVPLDELIKQEKVRKRGRK